MRRRWSRASPDRDWADTKPGREAQSEPRGRIIPAVNGKDNATQPRVAASCEYPLNVQGVEEEHHEQPDATWTRSPPAVRADGEDGQPNEWCLRRGSITTKATCRARQARHPGARADVSSTRRPALMA